MTTKLIEEKEQNKLEELPKWKTEETEIQKCFPRKSKCGIKTTEKTVSIKNREGKIAKKNEQYEQT